MHVGQPGLAMVFDNVTTGCDSALPVSRASVAASGYANAAHRLLPPPRR